MTLRLKKETLQVLQDNIEVNGGFPLVHITPFQKHIKLNSAHLYGCNTLTCIELHCVDSTVTHHTCKK